MIKAVSTSAYAVSYIYKCSFKLGDFFRIKQGVTLIYLNKLSTQSYQVYLMPKSTLSTTYKIWTILVSANTAVITEQHNVDISVERYWNKNLAYTDNNSKFAFETKDAQMFHNGMHLEKLGDSIIALLPNCLQIENSFE